MGSTKHTRGPWELCGFFIRTEYAMGERDKAGWLIATLDNSLPNWQDYGRLMTAAPELLAALRDIESSTAYAGCEMCNEVHNVARAAIAKAVGHD